MNQASSSLIFNQRCYQRKETNPYHERLEDFQDFVLRDHESEQFLGNWNEKVFRRNAPLVVEIGVGYGDFMANYCQENPQENFVGLDIRFKRSFNVAKKLSQFPEKNFRFLRATGERLPIIFGKQEIDKLFCFFPDPWPKKRHHKKRLFQRQFFQELAPLIKKNGLLLFKTDHEHLFPWMMEQLEGQSSWDILWHTTDMYQDYLLIKNQDLKNTAHSLVTFPTKFEKIFIQQNAKIKALILKPRVQ